MSRESFGEKLDRGPESFPEDIDKIPPPESFPEPMPGEEDDGFPDHLPEQELLNEKENMEQEDAVEEGIREELKQKEWVLIPEEIKKDDIAINEYIIELKKTIDGIKEEMEKADGKDRTKLRGLLKELQVEYTGLSGMVIDIEAGNFDEITERPVA